MNPIAQAALTSIVRWVLALGAGYLVKAGIWTGSDAQTYVTAAALALVALGWGLFDKYKARVKFLTALAAPAGTTENDVKFAIAVGSPTPSVMTPPDTVPGVPRVDAIDPKRFVGPAVLLALALAGAGGSACATGKVVAGVPTSPVEQAQALRELDRAAHQSLAVVTIARDVQTIEIAWHADPLVRQLGLTDAVHRDVQEAFLLFATTTRPLLELARDVAKGGAARQEAVGRIRLAVGELIRRVLEILPPGRLQTDARVAFGALSAAAAILTF